VLTSCKKNEGYGDIKNKIAGAKGYRSIAEITIYGNKGISKYKVKQYCIYPDKLRVETLEPDFLKNKVVIRNNNMWKIYHPLINQVLIISKLMDEDEIILMGIIQKQMFVSDSSIISHSTYCGEKCITIKSNIPNGNKYRKTVVLYVEGKNALPLGMDILDDNGNKKVEIKYIDFIYSGNFSDSLFNLK
jgi:outer membrane lipoprotein-sorting protein